MAREWEYTVQLTHDVRMYVGDENPRHGSSWSLTRQTSTSDGKPFNQSIVVSAEVFDNDEEAKEDALRKLSILRCPLDQPLDKAIKWMLDD